MANNILGINLDIDEDVIENAVKQTVMASIASAMDEKKVVSALVSEVLNTRVNYDGKVSNYSSENKYTLLEYYLRTNIRNAATEYTKQLIEDRMPQIKDAVRAEIEKSATTDSLVDAFFKSMGESLNSRWSSHIDVKFSIDD